MKKNKNKNKQKTKQKTSEQTFKPGVNKWTDELMNDDENVKV